MSSSSKRGSKGGVKAKNKKKNKGRHMTEKIFELLKPETSRIRRRLDIERGEKMIGLNVETLTPHPLSFPEFK